jgi:hypothetical protein
MLNIIVPAIKNGEEKNTLKSSTDNCELNNVIHHSLVRFPFIHEKIRLSE